MQPLFKFPCGQTRRQFLWQSGNGFVGTAITYMLAREGVLQAQGAAATAPFEPPVHHLPRAKACIFLTMVGGPSHLDVRSQTGTRAVWSK